MDNSILPSGDGKTIVDNFVGNGMGKFKFNPTSLVIDQSVSFDEWLGFGDVLKQMNQGIQFWIGDWLNFGEKKWGEKYSQALEETNYEYQTLRDMAWVAEKIPPSLRKDNLTYSHHKEVASLERKDQESLLNDAIENDLTVGQVRDKKYEITGIEPKIRHLICPKCGHEIPY